MRRAAVLVALSTVWAGSVLAAEMLVFKRESRYRGAALRINSLEEGRDGRLLITSANGDLYTAAAGDVDWDASRELTAALKKKEAEQADAAEAERAAAERAARLADQAGRAPLSVLEASRRYGVANPGMSVSDGSAAHDVGRATASPTSGAPAAAAADAKAVAADPKVVRAQARLDEAKANRDKLAKTLEGLRADTNPDPLSAANRTTQIERRSNELQAAEQKVAQAQAALEASQARAAAAAAMTPTP